MRASLPTLHGSSLIAPARWPRSTVGYPAMALWMCQQFAHFRSVRSPRRPHICICGCRTRYCPMACALWNRGAFNTNQTSCGEKSARTGEVTVAESDFIFEMSRRLYCLAFVVRTRGLFSQAGHKLTTWKLESESTLVSQTKSTTSSRPAAPSLAWNYSPAGREPGGTHGEIKPNTMNRPGVHTPTIRALSVTVSCRWYHGNRWRLCYGSLLRCDGVRRARRPRSVRTITLTGYWEEQFGKMLLNPYTSE